MTYNNLIPNQENFTEEYSEKLRKQYSDRIPVLVWNVASEDLDFTGSTRRFMVQKDTTLGQLLFILRKRFTLRADEGLFVFVGKNNIMASNAEVLGVLFDKYADDGFLRLTLSKESTFG